MESAECGWSFFIRNLESITESLRPPPPAPQLRPLGGNGAVSRPAAAGPAPIRWGAADVLLLVVVGSMVLC